MSGEVAEALPTVEESTQAGAVEQTQAPQEQTTDEAPAEAKPEKTPEQREIERLRRGIDRRTRQLAEARAHNQLTQRPIADINGPSADDSQPLSLTRADLAKIVKAEAERLAPTLASQHTEEARRQGVIESLAKTWGQEKFDEVASDLDEVFGGLTDASGSAKPAIEAVFEADDPVRLIEWLADPENADEAERISKLSAIRAGREIAKLEIRISQESEKLKPRVSKAPAPIEPPRGQGRAATGISDELSADEWRRRRTAEVQAKYR
jgi:soluble cytochrome b562